MAVSYNKPWKRLTDKKMRKAEQRKASDIAPNTMEHFKFMTNAACEYFPCHSGADPEQFNCLFCYCPLYVLGRDCGGAFSYTPEGRKDCSACRLPHTPEGYDYILSRYEDLAELEARLRGEAP